MNFIRRYSNYFMCGIVAVFFLLILILNNNTALIADDFYYAYVFGADQRVCNVFDIIISQINHYFTWGGRSVLHFLAQLFLLIGKPVFNVVNSVAYISLILVICFNSGCKNKMQFISLFLFTNFLIWFFIPRFGENILWLTGSCNYLWGMLLVLCMLVWYRRHLNNNINDSVLKCMGIFVLGLLSGWTNENTSIALISMIILFIICYKINNIKIPIWSIVGLLSTVIGSALMLIAPGNYIRSKYFVDDRSFIEKYTSRFIDITKTGISYFLPLIFVLLVLVCLNIYFKSYKNLDFLSSIIYLCGTIVSMYAMIFSPYFPERAWFGIIIYFVLCLGSLYSNLKFNNKLISLLTVSLLAISLPLFIHSYRNAYCDIFRTYDLYLEREKYIAENKAIGNYEIVVDKINPTTKYNGIISDISEEENHWINSAAAKYYGLKTIKGK